MTIKSSRYTNAMFFTETSRTVTFKGRRSRPIGLPAGVLEYTVKQGDRLDLLALHFYNDSRKWWRMLDANPEIVFAADLNLDDYVGVTIQIPKLAQAGS